MTKIFDLFWKGNFAKPGRASIHSAKWHRCIEHVSHSSSADNAYAVCTAVLGDESFKSEQSDEEFKAQIDSYIKRLNITSGMREKMGIEGAGSVPHSLLASQDLMGSSETTTKTLSSDIEDETEGAEHYNELADMYSEMASDEEEHLSNLESQKHIRHEGDKWNLYSRKTGKLLGSHKTKEGAEQQERAIQWFKHKSESEHSMTVDIDVHNGSDSSSEKTTDDLDTEEKKDLASQIQSIQEKRQRATIAARQAEGDAVGKSFKDAWKKLQQ